jgi:hypothetical protein
MNKELKLEVARRRVMDRSFTYKKMKAELASKVAYNSGPRFQEPDDVEILSPSQRESRIPRFSQRFANNRIITASPKKNEQLGSSQIQTRGKTNSKGAQGYSASKNGPPLGKSLGGKPPRL